jgi:tRNA modification GTPase
VIAGRPNAGKSSLFNALLGRQRAIVAEVPGTTRDAIEAAATCDGFPFRLIDTAGLRESKDVVERLGVEVSHRYLAAADVVLLCVDANREIAREERMFMDRMDAPTILVRTKSDLLEPERVGPWLEGDIVASALSGEGLAALRKRLAMVAFGQLGSGNAVDSVVTRERHRLSLETAWREIGEFGAARGSAIDAAVAATHLRSAVSALDDVIGIVTPDDVLDRVFATFCVGK